MIVDMITTDDQIDAVAMAAGITRRQARKAMDAVSAVVIAGLTSDDRIVIQGLGTFAMHHRRLTRVRNPQTGHMMEVPARDAIAFRPAKQLRQRVEDLRARKD